MTDEMIDDGHEPATKADLRTTQVDMRAMGTDLHTEMHAMGTDLRAEMHAMGASLSARLDSHDARFEKIDGNLHRLNVGFAQMSGDLGELKGKVDILLGVKQEMSRLAAYTERMANHFESCVRKMDFQGSMLMEHETRLTKLEARS